MAVACRRRGLGLILRRALDTPQRAAAYTALSRTCRFLPSESLMVPLALDVLAERTALASVTASIIDAKSATLNVPPRLAI